MRISRGSLAATILACLLLVFGGATDLIAGAGEDQLAQAHQLKMARSYSEARKLFLKLARDKQNPTEVRQEAAYFLGFCSVMEREYVRAVHDLKWYVKTYPDKGAVFAPDALFVLGRTHEMMGEPKPAEQYYRQCLAWPQSPGHDFTVKAKEGLERVAEMLREEQKLIKSGVVGKDIQASDTVRLRRDPYSRKELAPGQFQRIRQFTELLGKTRNLEASVRVLQPEDRELAMVKELFRMYQEHQQQQKKGAATKKDAKVHPKR